MSRLLFADQHQAGLSAYWRSVSIVAPVVVVGLVACKPYHGNSRYHDNSRYRKSQPPPKMRNLYI